MYSRILSVLLLLVIITKIQAHPGIGIVSDSKGNVFYTDLEHVWRIDTQGQMSMAVKNVHTHELYIDQEDNLYGEHEWYNGEATDTWGNYVWRLKRDGTFEKIIPDVEGFLQNNTLVRDPDNNSYFSEKSGDYEVLKKQTPEGKICDFSNYKFNDIRWIHYSIHDNNIYIVDGLTIKKADADGKVTIVANDLKKNSNPFGGVSDRHYVFGIWTDHESNLYAAIYGTGEVLKISPQGESKIIFKSNSFWAPVGGFTASDGTLWIMEFSVRNKTRVRRIDSDGTQKVFKS